MAEPRARPALIIAAAAAAAALAVTGCGPSGGEAAVHPAASQPAGSAAPAASADPASPSPAPTPAAPLAGKTVGIDPGHNGRNKDDPAYLNRMVFNGKTMETCDTTGTESNSGYAEAAFTFAVATDLRAELIRDGATVVMTRQNNDGVGPCVDRRAQILNAARASVAIDIHGDGGPASGRGFTVLEPVADGPNDGVIASSLRFGADVHAAMLAGTGMPVADYYGQNGYISRDDLAGLNLTTVPKILIECGNMRNATDAGLMQSPAFQQRLAAAFTAAIVKFLARPA
ncbi:MAG TPA: N-acetylmuramoyl-L-alanine amidase [Streptosporangiaceae bacterium]